MLSNYFRDSFALFSGGLGSVLSTVGTPEPLRETTQNLLQSASQINQPSQTLGQQIMIAGITAFGAFVVYVFGQIFTKFIIEPIHEQKRIIGEIADALIFYANKYFMLSEFYEIDPIGAVVVSSEEIKFRRRQAEKKKELNIQIVDRIRGLGTQLISRTYLIPMYSLLARFSIVKPMNKIVIAQTALIGLSNTVGTPDIENRRRFESDVREALDLFNPNEHEVERGS